MEIRVVGIVGSGQMGSGIAEAFLTAGFQVRMHDVGPQALERGVRRISDDLGRRVHKGKMAAAQRDDALSRLQTTRRLEDLARSDLVVEAATENVPLKGEIFKALDGLLGEGALLASNTSSISITRIASFTQRPQRVVGMHFFNPVPVMKLVEVIRGLETSEETFQAVMELCRRLGKTPIEARDIPGFISSRLIFTYMNEGIWTLYEGLGSAADIDAMMRLGANHPMGPLELADFVGLDTVLSVMRVLQEALGDKYRPCPLLVQHVAAGRLGIKTGRGLYDYGQRP